MGDPIVTVPAVPPKRALSSVPLLHGTNVEPSDVQAACVVLHVPLPPVPAPAPLGSQVRVCWAATGTVCSDAPRTAAAAACLHVRRCRQGRHRARTAAFSTFSMSVVGHAWRRGPRLPLGFDEARCLPHAAIRGRG